VKTVARDVSTKKFLCDPSEYLESVGSVGGRLTNLDIPIGGFIGASDLRTFGHHLPEVSREAQISDKKELHCALRDLPKLDVVNLVNDASEIVGALLSKKYFEAFKLNHELWANRGTTD